MAVSDLSLLPLIFWRCPLCHAEETFKTSSSGFLRKRWSARCEACAASWADLTPESMTLVEGPKEHLGLKSLDAWGELASGTTDIQTIDVDVPVLLKDGEGVVKVGWAGRYEDRTRTERRGGRGLVRASVSAEESGSTRDGS